MIIMTLIIPFILGLAVTAALLRQKARFFGFWEKLALAFAVGGSQVFAKHVMRPAYALPPHSFLRAALDDTRPTILTQLDDAVAEATQS